MKNLLKAYCILVILIFPSYICSQTIDTIWTKPFINDLSWDNYFDSANYIAETQDKGFIITGRAILEGVTWDDIALIKTDSLGNVEWSRLIGDTVSECGFHVLPDYDGGFLISANSYGFGNGGGGIWIIKTDNAGDTLWTYSFLPDDRSGYPLYAAHTADSGYAITGVLNLNAYYNEAFILILDKNGDFVDYDHFGGDMHFQDGCYIALLPDSGFIVAGRDNNPYTTDYDFRAFRTDKNLNLAWDSTYIITESTDLIYGATLLDDGLVMVGDAAQEGYAIKIDLDGNTIWSKSISQYFTGERNTSAVQAVDGGIIVGGWVWVTGHRRDFTYIRLDHEGNVVSVFSFGGTEDDHPQAIVPTYDGNFVTTGISYSFAMGSCVYMAKLKEIYNSPAGRNVDVILNDDINIVFDNINTSGETEIEITSTGPGLPGSFITVPSDPVTYFNLSTTAHYDGNIAVCFAYDPLNVDADESSLKLYHHNGVEWDDITTALDTENNVICGATLSLSPFIIAQPSPTGIVDFNREIPEHYQLSQNYPNPFNPETYIKFSLPASDRVLLEIYNITGQKIRTLIDKQMSPGEYTINWDGCNTEGKKVASGIYLFRLVTENFVQTKKMTLIK